MDLVQSKMYLSISPEEGALGMSPRPPILDSHAHVHRSGKLVSYHHHATSKNAHCLKLSIIAKGCGEKADQGVYGCMW
jgi:hypothetical protein